MKKRIIGVLLVVFCIIGFLPNVYAGNLTISASSKSVNPGDTVTITVKADGLAGRFSVSSSNSSVLSGGSNGDWLENSSNTYKFTAKSIGSATITVKSDNAADFNGTKYTASKSVTINVVKPREKSTNNNLKSLEVSGYSLSPEFNKDILEYTVEVGDSKEKITINAIKEDGYASLSGTGEKDVVEGTNKFEIKVTSETGVEKVYTLNVNVKDNNPIEKTVDGKTYTVVKRGSSLQIPVGYSEEDFILSKILINELEIPVLYSEKLNINLIGLRDELGTIYLYKTDESGNISEKFETISSKNIIIKFENPKEELEGYTKTVIKVDDKEYTVYQTENYKDYALIYGTNLETEESKWYLYNIKENSIQAYTKDIIDDLNKTNQDKIDEYKIALLFLAGLSLLLLIIIIIQIISKSKLKKKLIKKIQLLKNEILSKEESNAQKELEVVDNAKKEENKSTLKSKNNKKQNLKKD